MTFAITLGRAVGRAAATTVHAACVATVATGRFGQDVALGTSAGYAEHSTRLAALRAQSAKARPASIAIAIAREPAPTTRRTRAHA